MGNALRDDRIDREELEGWLEDIRSSIEGARPRVRGGGGTAAFLCRDDSTCFELEYAAGTAVRDLAATLDEWAEDVSASLRIPENATDATSAVPLAYDDGVVLQAAIDLVFVASGLGRGDVATAVLTHPAVVAVPCRVLDGLAVIHGVQRPVSQSEVLAGSYDPWLEVASADPSHRQGKFERYVRGWRGHGEKVRSLAPVDEFFTGAWAFEAVVLAQVFGLDDGPVREVAEYPVDLADFAQEAELPRLDPEVRLPGPWQKPAAPTVIAPATAREPVAVAGEPGLADIAALVSPVGGDRLTAPGVEELLDAALEAGTVLSVDAQGMDPAEAGALVQLACQDLGLSAPGRVPGQLPKDPAKALPKLDAWLAAVGVRLLAPATDTDDLLIFPVLAADYERFAGQSIDGLRLRTMDQLATDEA